MSDSFDDRLRSQMSRAVPHAPDAHATLGSITPALTRARRVSQLKAGLTGVAMLLVSTGVAAALTNLPDEQVTVIATADDTEATTSTTTAPTFDQATTSSIASHSDQPTTSTPEAADADQPTSTESSPTVDSTTEPSPTTTASAAPSSSSTSSTSTPGSTSSSTTSPSSTTSSIYSSANPTLIVSDCGSIEVDLDDDDITLVETSPHPGYETDSKSTGPEKVEVSFEGPGGHCEIEAEVRNSELWTDISTE